MPATTSSISHNLPHFPYSPAIAARPHFSALLSSSHFVTTLVSSPSCSSSSPDLADPSQEITEFFSTRASPVPSSPSFISPQPSVAPQSDLSALIEPLVKHAPSKRPSRGLHSSKLSASPLIVEGEQSVTQKEVDEIHSARPRRCRSLWCRLRRMGNRFVTPFRSMGLCMTGGRSVLACYDDRAADGSSQASSCCSSGDYSRDFIRAVLENNVLLGYLTSD